LGVVGQIIPWNFPILMARGNLAPCTGGWYCVVLNQQSKHRRLFLSWFKSSDLLAPGLISSMVTVKEAGQALASS